MIITSAMNPLGVWWPSALYKIYFLNNHVEIKVIENRQPRDDDMMGFGVESSRVVMIKMLILSFWVLLPQESR